MCQLILCNLNHPVLNKIATTLLLLIDSKALHKDGFGLYCNNYLYKDMKEPSLEDEIGTIVCNGVDANPVIGHVRQASIMFKNNKKVEHNHPFEFDHLIGAHNGTLESNTNLTTKYKDQIDSYQFFAELNNNLTNSTMVTALNKTMSEFKGKFAFIIKDKRDNNYYVVRGRTADLHIVDIYLGDDYLGFIVNTEKASLVSALGELKLIANSIGYFDFKTSEIRELEKETIYILKDNYLSKVGEIKEVDRIVTTYYETATGSYYENQKKAYYLYSRIEAIAKFLDEASLSIVSLDEIFDIWYGVPTNGMSLVLLDDFIKETIPLLKRYINNKKLHLWRELCKLSVRPYTEYDLEFPWFLNERNELGTALTKAQIKRRKEKNGTNTVL